MVADEAQAKRYYALTAGEAIGARRHTGPILRGGREHDIDVSVTRGPGRDAMVTAYELLSDGSLPSVVGSAACPVC